MADKYDNIAAHADRGDGTYIFEKSSHWRSDTLEKMMKEHNDERDRKIAYEGSLLLNES